MNQLYVTPVPIRSLDLHTTMARFSGVCDSEWSAGPYNIAEDVLSLETIAGILENLGANAHNDSSMARGGAVLGVLDFGFGDLVRLQSGMPMATTKMASALGTPKLSSRQSLALWRVEQQHMA